MKPGDRWKKVKYAYTHNRIPEPQPRTTFEQILAALKLTEAEALQIALTPNHPMRGKLWDACYEEGNYKKKYVPLLLLIAYGREREVEKYVDDAKGGRLRIAPKKGGKS